MKSSKIIYWITTGLVSLLMLFSFYAYMTSPDIKGAFIHLGFPDYFRVELAIAKLFGALALIIPFVPARIKEWAYFGFFVNFVSAFIAHVASGDPVNNQVFPLVLLALLVVSYVYYTKVKTSNVKMAGVEK